MGKPGRVTKKREWVACLIVLQGTGIGDRIRLDKEELSIGRADQADIRLEQGGVSREHALIRRDNDGNFEIIDQNSTNSIWVNSKKCHNATLKDQDLIAIGEYLLKFIDSNSSEQAHYEELFQQACMDKVLQVYNKHYFLTRLDEEIARCERNAGTFSLILLDADHFKLFNDNHGHLAGDAALLQLTTLIRKNIRKVDVPCRYGGEEFTVILPDADIRQALVVAEHIRSLVAKKPVEYANNSIPLTVSIGIAQYHSDPAQAASGETLIAHADNALYQAKQDGRNRTVMFRPKSA